MTFLHFNNLEIAFLSLDYILSDTSQIPPPGKTFKWKMTQITNFRLGWLLPLLLRYLTDCSQNLFDKNMLINLHCIIRIVRLARDTSMCFFHPSLRPNFRNESKYTIRTAESKRNICHTPWFTHPIQHRYGKGPRTLCELLKATVRANNNEVSKQKFLWAFKYYWRSDNKKHS